MPTTPFAGRALWLCAAASVLTSCSGIQPVVNPLNSTQASSLALAGRKAPDDLIYTGSGTNVELYTFPDGRYQGAFTAPDPMSGMCADAKGNVFIDVTQTSSSADTGYVYEYEHGGMKPVASLAVPKHDVPIACSSDPTTGNLAVTLQNSHNYAPSVAIYAKAAGKPKIYDTSVLGANPQAGYDDRGNLFATSGGNVGAQLPAGKSRFVKVNLTQTLGGVAHVQWDGTDLALQSFDYSKHNGEKILERVFRLQVSGTTGKIVETIRFHNWSQKDAGESWIQGDAMVATPFGAIALWRYPSGGKAFKVIHPTHRAKAITISPAS